MQKIVSNSFAITASKDAVSFDHQDNYSLIEASGTMPLATDSRWQYIPVGGQALKPTAAAPYLWHKTITFLTDGSHLEPVISFGGSLGQNGIDYDLVPSASSILKAEDGTLTPTGIYCSIVKRNADGSAQKLSSVPSGYSIMVYRDNVSEAYALGSTVFTSGLSVISFVLMYGSTDIERHDIRVISEGSQGLNGRGIQSQDYRYKATNSAIAPNAPTNDNEWNTWLALASANYSELVPYLWKCIKTVYVDGSGVTDTEYHVEGPSVWGKSGESAFIVDLDNEMTSVPISSDGKVESAITIGFNLKGFYGQTDVTANCSVTPNPNSNWPSGFTCDTSTPASPQITIAANTIPSAVSTLEFKVSHSKYGDRYVNFTIAAVRSGGVGQNAVLYELLPSLTEIAVGRTSSGGYTPNPLTYGITCGYVKYNGQTVASSSSNLTGAIDGYYIYFRMRQRSNNTWGTYYKYSAYKSTYLDSGKFNVLTYNKLEFILCKNTSNTIASETAVTALVDRESIPVVADGTNGTSPYTVDLDNEMCAIACDADGKVVVGTTFTLRVSAWYGITDVTAALTFDTISIGNSDITYTNTIATDHELKVTVPTGITLDDVTEVYIPVKHSTYEPAGRTLIFSISAVRPGTRGAAAVLRELLPSLSQMSFARVAGTNTLTPAARTVTVSIRRTEGGVSTVKTLTEANVTVCWNINSMPENKNSGYNIASNGCTVYNSTTATNVYLAAFDSTTGELLDKETIPIIKDGEIGSSGNGTDTVVLARMFTMGFESPSNTDSGWILETASNYPTEKGLSETNRYLWQRKKTTYTLTSDVTYEISLINQFQSGVRENLLEDTAFREDNEMDAWDTHVGSVILNTSTQLPQNGWQQGPNPSAGYTDILVQKVWDGSSVKKVLPNKWYTLSFYAAQETMLHLFSGTAYNNDTTGAISAAKKMFYLGAGCSAVVYVTGYITNAAVSYMRIKVWSYDGTFSTYSDLRTTNSTTVAISVANTGSSGQLFYVCPYMYDNSGNLVTDTSITYRGYCSKVDVDRGHCLNTYINRSNWSSDAVQHGTDSVMYVDGVKVTGPTTLADGTVVRFDAACTIVWKLSPSPVRHSVTFKTAPWGTTTDTISVRFRNAQYSHYGWVCMPKLEENTIATEWIENSRDRYADDFQHIYVGDWKASTTEQIATYYMYALGVRHVVRAKKSATESDMTYFRLKKRTPNTGYCSIQQPYADTTNWEEASYLRFVAAELMLAEEVITDKLTVTKIQGKNNCFVVDENGNVTANGGNFNNIQLTGFMRVSPIRVNSSNWQQYAIKDENLNEYYLNARAFTNCLIFDSSLNSLIASGQLSPRCYLPNDDPTLCGTFVRLVNLTSYSFGISGRTVGEDVRPGVVSPQSQTLFAGYEFYCQCLPRGIYASDTTISDVEFVWKINYNGPHAPITGF